MEKHTKDHDIFEVIRSEQTEHSERMNYWAEEGEQRRAQTMQIKTQNKPVVLVHTYKPSTQEAQEEYLEFESSLFLANYRPTRAAW